MLKIKKRWILKDFCVLLVVLMVVSVTMRVNAACSDGIRNNGTGDIWIDINAAPYSSNWSCGDPYGEGGCTWFVGSRVMQLTGKGDYVTQTGSTWYSWYGESLGFSKGTEIKAPAIVCWSGHVAILEKIDGDTAYLSEGGVGNYKNWGTWNSDSNSSNGYSVIHAISLSEVQTWCGIRNDYLGCIYLTGVGNNPVGYVDSITAGVGYIDVKGWAYDMDAVSRSIDVHIYIGGGVGTAGTEGHSIKANVSRKDVDKAYGVGEFHGFEARIYTNKTGNQPVYVYAINVGSGNENTELKNTKVNILTDTQKPTISDVKIYDVTKDGYSVSCVVSDNIKVTKVKFPSWNVVKNEPLWIEGNLNNNIATVRVDISELSGGSVEGWYNTHIYAYDAAGNASSVSINNNTGVFIDKTVPSITNVSIENLTSEGYRVKCKIEDSGSGIDHVKFPTWTSKGGQDDLIAGWVESTTAYQGIQDGDSWYFDVKTSEHSYETGKYATYIYAWDKQGNLASYSLSPCNNIVVPEAISDDEDTNESDEELDNEDAEESDEESDDEETDEDLEDDIEIGDIIEDPDDEMEYEVIEISDDEYAVELMDYSGEEPHIVIPKYIEVDGIDYKVTAIAKNAFKNNKRIKKVTIGNNVVMIGDGAFSGCKKLKTVVIGKNVKTIGNKAFLNCISLTKVTIPSKVTKVGSYAFKNCKKLTNITFGSSVKSIGKEALRGCSKLKLITIKSKKLKTVGKNALKGIKSTAKIKVPSSKLKTYKKLLKSKGQGKKVKITK